MFSKESKDVRDRRSNCLTRLREIQPEEDVRCSLGVGKEMQAQPSRYN